MKIITYKKKKNNLYEITLSNNEKISLYDDVILKYELLLKKEIKNNELKNIIEDNSKLESYFVALKYLNTKLRTEKEVRKKLMYYSKDAIDYTIDRLQKENYLNEERYLKSYINDEINLKMVGQNKIINDLKKLGLSIDLITNYLDNIENDIWLNKIRKYITKKINSNHNYSSIVLKQKIQKDLLVKGFYIEDINSVLSEFVLEDDTKILEKEYEKLKNKLSKKYSGEELNYRIKIALLKKGFKD